MGLSFRLDRWGYPSDWTECGNRISYMEGKAKGGNHRSGIRAVVAGRSPAKQVHS